MYKICIKPRVMFVRGAAGPADTRSARQPQGAHADRGQDELHQSVAVAAGIRHLAVRRQVHGPQEGRAVGHSVQQVDAHGHHHRRSHKDMEIQHNEGAGKGAFIFFFFFTFFV